jgi:hypothetical protein
MSNAYMEYNDENDKLQSFIINECCEIGPLYHVNAKISGKN